MEYKKEKSLEELVDTLAVITKEGFDELSKKMDSGFAAVNDQFDELNNKFDLLEYRVNSHDRRLDTVEDKVIVMNKKLA